MMKIVELLRKHSADKLNFTYMAAFTQHIAGRKYRDAIREAIYNANLFFLLLPDPSDDWDWCLFETGMFEAHGTSADRLICIRHPDNPMPSQIEDYHGVCATISELEDLLRLLYIRADLIPGLEPINSSLDSETTRIAREIHRVLRPPKKHIFRQIFQPWVEIRIEDESVLKSPDAFDEARIASCNDDALELFGFIRKPETWGVLRSEIGEFEADHRWRQELFDAIRRVAVGRKFSPIQAVFKHRSGKMYRPLACAVDRVGDVQGPIDVYHITFIEEVGVVDSSSIPKEIAGLATLVRFAFRFRWEILEKFSKPLQEADVQRLESALFRIQTDWKSRGVGDQTSILKLFSQQKADRITQMFETYKDLRNEYGTGELDAAIRERDFRKIPALLARILPMNQQFLEITADRFSELVSGKA